VNRGGVPAVQLAEGLGVGPCRFDQLGVGPHSRGLHAVGQKNVSVLSRAHGDQLHLAAVLGSGAIKVQPHLSDGW
jgi:hypothetical protein